MTYCGKCNTWNGVPYAHTTTFHDATLLAGTSYYLSTTHQFHHHHSTNNKSIGTSAPVLNTAASVSGGGIATNNALIQVSKSKATQVLCTFQTSTPDGDDAALADALGEALELTLSGVACPVAMNPFLQTQTPPFYDIVYLDAMSTFSISRPAFFSESLWCHWNPSMCLLCGLVHSILFQVTNEVQTRSSLYCHQCYQFIIN